MRYASKSRPKQCPRYNSHEQLHVIVIGMPERKKVCGPAHPGVAHV